MMIIPHMVATDDSKVGVTTSISFRVVAGLSLLCCTICPLYAADLPDPTRPPASITGTANFTAPAVNVASGLRSTIISGSHRAAIIDGVTVELWAKHGGDQLVEVNEGSVVLMNGKKRRVLNLFPDVKMIPRK